MQITLPLSLFHLLLQLVDLTFDASQAPRQIAEDNDVFELTETFDLHVLRRNRIRPKSN